MMRIRCSALNNQRKGWRNSKAPKEKKEKEKEYTMRLAIKKREACSRENENK